MAVQMLESFEPAEYSLPELHFAAEHLGASPHSAFRKGLPPGAHQRRLELLFGTVYENEQLAAAEDGFVWAGKAAIIDSITRYLEWYDRSKELARRKFKDAVGAIIHHPSMYVWDDGRAFKGGVEADAADMVRSEILPDGSRRRFGVMLLQGSGEILPDISSVAPWIRQATNGPITKDEIADEKSTKDKRVATLRCTICDHTEQYDNRQRQSRNLAKGRMVRHLKKADKNMNRHRALLTKYNG